MACGLRNGPSYLRRYPQWPAANGTSSPHCEVRPWSRPPKPLGGSSQRYVGFKQPLLPTGDDTHVGHEPHPPPRPIARQGNGEHAQTAAHGVRPSAGGQEDSNWHPGDERNRARDRSAKLSYQIGVWPMTGPRSEEDHHLRRCQPPQVSVSVSTSWSSQASWLASRWASLVGGTRRRMARALSKGRVMFTRCANSCAAADSSCPVWAAFA